MAFGKLGAMGRGFGTFGAFGGVGISSPYAFWQANPSAQGAWFRWDMTGDLQSYTTIGSGPSNPNDGETLALSIGKYQSSDTIGSNLISNGDFATGDLTSWNVSGSTAPSTFVVTNGVATSSTNGSATARLRQTATVEVGCAYLVQHDGTCPVAISSTSAYSGDIYTSSTAFDTIVVATTTGLFFSFLTATNGLTVDNVKVFKIPGFAARQSSASLRPLWKANLGGYRLPDGVDDVDTVTFPASFTGDIIDYNPLTGVVTEQVGVSIGTTLNLPNNATRHVVIMPSGYDSWRAKIVAWMKAQAIGLYGVADGDSHTKNSTFLSSPQQYWPALLSKTMQGEGRNIAIGNFGVGGSTSADCLTRANAMSGVSRQAFSLIYVGTNDGAASNQSAVQASPSPTTTTFSVAAGKGALFPVGCQIFVGSDSREVLARSTDAITVAALSGIPSAGTTVKLDTRQNIVKIGQRLQAIGFTNLLVGVMHYYDYTDGTGDTLAAENATQATLRALQRAAATDLGATQVDFYAYMRALLVAGTYTPLSAAWHVANTDPHLNAIGQGILRDAIRAAIPAGWI